MTRPAVRVVQPGEAASVEMHEAAEALLRRFLALNPVAVMIAIETPDHTMECLAVPESQALANGMVIRLYEELYPENGE